ncbi:hypothetical protein HNV12_19560 [Methanococcoides sp. SA1]|nr:hypothetical protein [Methanococcoides sp. SA1]
MNKKKFLTKKWNNILTLSLGMPILAFGITGFATPLISEFWDFIGMCVFAAVY